MATTATITLTSDIYDGFGSINKTMTMTKGGTSNDLVETTGFQRIKFNTTSATDIITMANELVEPLDNLGAKVYIKNIGDGRGNFDKSQYVLIGVKAQPVGRLYGGDWMMMPLTGIDADDVTATPSTNDAVVLEYAMYYEEN